jgi:methylenetetrahydrofolate dehydrogenase (NADP+)/methenyltetrahydrofolate cyclohydrolase
MTEAVIIDGKACAETVRAAAATRAAALLDQFGVTLGLAVVLVGEDPASQIYVRNKIRQTEKAGMLSFAHRLPADVPESEVLNVVARLNDDTRVHGILVQLPLPAHIDESRVLAAVEPAKDVDGFHLVNVGRLATGTAGAVAPCTPAGCVHLIKTQRPNLTGLRALVVGRSNIVGKPMAHLLLAEHCTVTIAHSRTRDLADECRRADILVAAVGRPQFITGDWVKPGAIVIDVGINRIPAADGKTRLVGDVDFDAASKVAAAITPVPGGVGPMTVAYLLENTVSAAARQIGAAD